jgi:uncharacterized protein YxjI
MEVDTFSVGSKLVIKEDIWSTNRRHNIQQEDGKLIGTVELADTWYKRLFSIEQPQFLYDADHNLVAAAKQKVFSWVDRLGICDASGNPIAIVKKDYSWNKNWQYWSSYQVYQEKAIENIHLFDIHIAKLFPVLRYEFFDLQGNTVAILTRNYWEASNPSWYLGFTYHVEILDPKAIDYRVIMFVIAYKTAYDRRPRHGSSNSRSSRSS